MTQRASFFPYAIIASFPFSFWTQPLTAQDQRTCRPDHLTERTYRPFSSCKRHRNVPCHFFFLLCKPCEAYCLPDLVALRFFAVAAANLRRPAAVFFNSSIFFFGA